MPSIRIWQISSPRLLVASKVFSLQNSLLLILMVMHNSSLPVLKSNGNKDSPVGVDILILGVILWEGAFSVKLSLTLCTSWPCLVRISVVIHITLQQVSCESLHWTVSSGGPRTALLIRAASTTYVRPGTKSSSLLLRCHAWSK